MRTSLITILLILTVSSCSTGQTPSLQEAEEITGENEKMVDRVIDSLKNEVYLSVAHVHMRDTNKLDYSLIGKRNLIRITCTPEGNILVRNEKLKGTIYDEVQSFYKANRDSNDRSNNYPFYSNCSPESTISSLNKVREEIKIAQEENYSDEMIGFKYQQEAAWLERLEAHSVLENRNVLVINSIALIGVQCQTESNRNLILHEILTAIYDLRNEYSTSYFKENYASLYLRTKTQNKEDDLMKLRTLKMLVPIAIIDEANLQKYKNRMFSFSSIDE